MDSGYPGLFKIRTLVLNLRVGQLRDVRWSSPLEHLMAVRRRKFFQQIGGTIQDLLSSLDTGTHFELVRLIRLWPEIVGQIIARRTEVSSLKFHTAIVRVSTAMWIQELNLMRPQIMSRVNAAMRNDAVREIRFVLGRMSRRERGHLHPVGRSVRSPVQLPELQDPELRRAFENLIEAWGRSPR